MTYLLIAITAIIFIYLCVCYFIAGSVIHLNRQPVPKNPKNYGMDFENIEFKTSDGVNIDGWLIPGSLKKLVIMTHVGGLTKYGSTVTYKNPTKLYDKEIEFLLTARHLHEKGYWVLMFDFRNHGESGADPNRGIAGVGLEEYRDVVAAMNFIKGRDELRDMNVGFVSFCMGANSTIIAMSKVPRAFRNVKCLFAVQPISMEVFLRTYVSQLLTPVGAKLLLPMVKQFIVWRGAHPLGEMSSQGICQGFKGADHVRSGQERPLDRDERHPGFYEGTPDNPKDFFWIENTTHRFESYSYFQDKPEKMLEWIGRWL